MAFGDDKEMACCEWIDIEEGEGVFIFVDFVARDFAFDNFTEDAIWIMRSLFLCHDSSILKLGWNLLIR